MPGRRQPVVSARELDLALKRQQKKEARIKADEEEKEFKKTFYIQKAAEKAARKQASEPLRKAEAERAEAERLRWIAVCNAAEVQAKAGGLCQTSIEYRLQCQELENSLSALANAIEDGKFSKS
jgi:hypothetical protein